MEAWTLKKNVTTAISMLSSVRGEQSCVICDATCKEAAGQIRICGDNVEDPEEACDEGHETATCDGDCTPVECGDGRLNTEAGEICDDGNSDNGDGCDNNCTPTGCQNGVETAGEECDSKNDVNDDGCDRRTAHCPDVVILSSTRVRRVTTATKSILMRVVMTVPKRLAVMVFHEQTCPSRTQITKPVMTAT